MCFIFIKFWTGPGDGECVILNVDNFYFRILDVEDEVEDKQCPGGMRCKRNAKFV